MTTTSKHKVIDTARLRAWRFQRQGLDGSWTRCSPAEVLERSGWARSVGGCGPYLGIWSRSGATRAAVDQAVAAVKIHELPAARGCTYIVPAADFSLALCCSQTTSSDSDLRTARNLGVTDRELERLYLAVQRALAQGPCEPDELRTRVGTAARSLGDEGKRKGITSTLPLALGRLQQLGVIRRIPTNGRLDQQRYRYTLWQPNPLGKQLPSPTESSMDLARRFFRWVGPATASEFQWFSGLGANASRAALAELPLVAVPGKAELLLFSDDLESLRAFREPREPRYAVVSSLDSFVAHRRAASDFIEPGDLARIQAAGGQRKAAGSLSELPHHAVFDRGRLVGLWEFDQAAGEIVPALFVKPSRELRAALDRAQSYIVEQLGDARSFSLDAPAKRGPQIAAVLKLAGGTT